MAKPPKAKTAPKTKPVKKEEPVKLPSPLDTVGGGHDDPVSLG